MLSHAVQKVFEFIMITAKSLHLKNQIVKEFSILRGWLGLMKLLLLHSWEE